MCNVTPFRVANQPLPITPFRVHFWGWLTSMSSSILCEWPPRASNFLMKSPGCGTKYKQPVYIQCTLSHSIFYPLFSGYWWSGSPTNTMFRKWVKNQLCFAWTALKVIQPWIFHMLNNSITDLHPATNNRLCLYCERYGTSSGKNHLKRWLLVGARLPYGVR